MQFRCKICGEMWRPEHVHSAEEAMPTLGDRIVRASKIQGWMSEPELSWLAHMAGEHYRIAEIGSWKGRSTAALAGNTRGVVFAVDTWQGSMEHSKSEIGEQGELFKQFLQNMKGLPVVALQGTSMQAAEHFQKSEARIFDMVFIDGSHEPEDVRADIQSWKQLLQPGGLLCGHDYNWTGVGRVVKEELGVVELPVGSIWAKESGEERDVTRI